MKDRHDRRGDDTDHRRLEARMQVSEAARQRAVDRHPVQDARQPGHQRVDRRGAGAQERDAEPDAAERPEHLQRERGNRTRRVEQVREAVGAHRHVRDLAADRRAVQEHADRDADEAQRHRARNRLARRLHFRRERRDELAADEHEHRHPDQRQHGRHRRADFRAAEPAVEMHGRRGRGSRIPKIISDSHMPAVSTISSLLNTLMPMMLVIANVTTRPTPTSHELLCFSNAAFSDSKLTSAMMPLRIVSAVPANTCTRKYAEIVPVIAQKRPSARQVIVNRAGRRQHRGGFGEGRRLRLHHHERDDHRYRERPAAHPEARRRGENHRACHDEADGARQRGRKADRARLQRRAATRFSRRAGGRVARCAGNSRPSRHPCLLPVSTPAAASSAAGVPWLCGRPGRRFSASIPGPLVDHTSIRCRKIRRQNNPVIAQIGKPAAATLPAAGVPLRGHAITRTARPRSPPPARRRSGRAARAGSRAAATG